MSEEPKELTEDELNRACCWSDYRKDYGVDSDHLSAAHQAFCAGWDAARGNLDAGGPLR